VWSGASEELLEESGGFIRDAHDLVRGLAVEPEIELGLRSTVVPVVEALEFAAPQAAIGDAVRLTVMLTRGVCRSMPGFRGVASAAVTMPRAIRPGPPSFSLAKTKMTSPLAMRLPPYMVFCPLNANAFAARALISVLMAYMSSFAAPGDCRVC
jgi:hypothetical protein